MSPRPAHTGASAVRTSTTVAAGIVMLLLGISLLGDGVRIGGIAIEPSAFFGSFALTAGLLFLAAALIGLRARRRRR